MDDEVVAVETKVHEVERIFNWLSGDWKSNIKGDARSESELRCLAFDIYWHCLKEHQEVEDYNDGDG